MTGKGECTHVGDHQGQNQAVSTRHFKDNKDRSHWGTNDTGKDSSHSDHRECADSGDEW